MYKLISIINAMMTRDILIQNLETGTKDLCFDDSALNSIDNFEFMVIGNTYKCKIRLFGIMDNDKNHDRVVLCKILEKNIIIGDFEYARVSVNKDIYYISQNDIFDVLNQKELLFRISRKDIIQVNDIIHPALLNQ